jgi:alkanesulfonate monooxygenase SsuD/methylene tetrahydromethanopterin reductase-like flavin-dependent oxidoreductase (luciferase family)
MEFGVFDHLDRHDIPLLDYYEQRLRLIEAYDRAGFYAYHLAEHHFTPLGMAPAPSVFLAAVAQRTRKLRFGPLVYALPLHHPLRLAEEICMLDQLSGGRLEIGFGRVSSPPELAYYGVDPKQAQEIYAEELELVLHALANKTLTFEGKRFSFRDVPMTVEPLQKPHPPVWYGAHSPDSAERAARRGFHIASLDPPGEIKAAAERFRATWRALHGDKALPKIGIGCIIVVAASDDDALRIARRAYPVWHKSFTHLFRMHGLAQAHPRPSDFDAMIKRGQAIAGAPAKVAPIMCSANSPSATSRSRKACARSSCLLAK